MRLGCDARRKWRNRQRASERKGTRPVIERACETEEPTNDEEQPQESPRWISIREAARRANLPSRTLYNWIAAGTWPVRVFKYSEHTYRVRLDEFEQWLAARRAEQGE